MPQRIPSGSWKGLAWAYEVAARNVYKRIHAIRYFISLYTLFRQKGSVVIARFLYQEEDKGSARGTEQYSTDDQECHFSRN